MLMISVKPQFACNILNGIKTGELRKNKALRNAVEKEIQEKGYCEIGMYVCKNGELLQNHWKMVDGVGKFILYGRNVKDRDRESPHTLNGKVVAKFKVRKVEDVKSDYHWKTIACLDTETFCKYSNCGKDKTYILHIEDLVIYDRPKELSDFLRYYNVNDYNNGVETNYFLQPNILLTTLTKAPQNYTRVFEKEGE